MKFKEKKIKISPKIYKKFKKNASLLIKCLASLHPTHSNNKKFDNATFCVPCFCLHKNDNEDDNFFPI